MGTPAPKAPAKTGSVSSIGPNGAAPAPRGIPKVKNTRDYGKPAPAPMAATPNPFGITDGGGRLGGI
jgi:hypothetical protein